MKRLNSFKKVGFFLLFIGVAACLTSRASWAISEKNYQQQFEATLLPFLKAGQKIIYTASDGMLLSGVKWIHPHSRGTILVLPGQGEPWLKYGEVFYDLFERGYSIFSYDHRGQGLSPHLVPKNSQIEHIDNFGDYITDLNGFVETIVKRDTSPGGPLYLLAHSMGGAIGIGYLESYSSPFRAAVLVAPMLQINTKPYAEPVALAIASAFTRLGKSHQYVIGKGDYDPFRPFSGNIFTSSRARFWMTNEISSRFPTTVIGGPSNEWVYRSIVASKKITKNMSEVKIPILMLQAGGDQIVKLDRQNAGCAAALECNLVNYPTSQHEILMEQDFIRDAALQKVEEFFR